MPEEARARAQVGGMGDVVTALARAVQEEGHAVRVIVPKYDCLNYAEVRPAAAVLLPRPCSAVLQHARCVCQVSQRLECARPAAGAGRRAGRAGTGGQGGRRPARPPLASVRRREAQAHARACRPRAQQPTLPSASCSRPRCASGAMGSSGRRADSHLAGRPPNEDRVLQLGRRG